MPGAFDFVSVDQTFAQRATLILELRNDTTMMLSTGRDRERTGCCGPRARHPSGQSGPCGGMIVTAYKDRRAPCSGIGLNSSAAAGADRPSAKTAAVSTRDLHSKKYQAGLSDVFRPMRHGRIPGEGTELSGRTSIEGSHSPPARSKWRSSPPTRML
jgi:hypothetical protein